ncbi:MAG: DUF2723 domain-containing protein [Chloroflexi bacterium]|nr:DUF2723 domain-containing protein [Chloroflexota bacterium]
MNSKPLTFRVGSRISWERLLAATCVGLFGLAVSRALFDSFPTLFGGLRWPAGLLISIALVVFLAFPSFSLSLSRNAFILLPLALSAFFIFHPTTNPLRDWVLILGGLGGALAIFLTTQLSNYPTLNKLYLFSLTLITSALYLRTLAPAVGEADTFEFQVNAIRLGISHGSGYPLYLLLAKLFSLLPIPGTTAFRINLSSAAFGVAATLMVYAVARALNASRPAAWIAALSLAASIGLWSRAVEAEVYTLHMALIGLLLWLSLRSQESGVRSQKILRLTAFVFGLSLTNHLTTVLLAPALLIALAPHLRPSSREAVFRHSVFLLLTSIFFFLLGLSLYLYLPLRWPAVNNGEVMTWELFRHFITGQEAQGALRLNAWYADLSRYAILGRKALDQFGWPGAMTALVGLAALFRRQPSAALVTLAAWAAFAFFGLSFYVPDPDYSSLLLPAHFVQAVWIACGIQAILDIGQFIIIKTRRHEDTKYWVLSIGYSVFFILPASLIWTNLPLVDQSGDWREYRLGQYILSQPLKENAAILADSELIAPLYYLQVAEGVRPDLDIVVLPNEDTYRAELESRIANGQTVYLGRYLPRLADAYYLRATGPLTEVKLEPSQLPESFSPVEQDFEDIIRLRGFQLDAATAPTDQSLLITLYWQALQPPPGNYRVVFRLLDSNGETRFISPANVPVNQMYPTAAWPLADVVADFHNLTLDPALEPGDYSLQVGLFPPFSERGLGDWATLADVTLQPPASPPRIAHPLRIRFANGVWLMGVDAPATAAPGSTIKATLYWLLPPNLGDPVTADLCLDELCSSSARIQLNPALHAPSQIVETRAVFNAPAAAGEHSLWIKLEAQTAECGWWSGSSPTCKAAELKIEGSPLAAEAVNFEDQIALESLKIETPLASPGQTVIVTATWRGLRPMESDYTVFIHLLGPDGIVHGQVDMWPVQGTRPTSQWPVNETIADRFEVRVPDDAPPGAYQVEAGWYLLATLDRLSVLDRNGVAIDDRFLIGGLTIK